MVTMLSSRSHGSWTQGGGQQFLDNRWPRPWREFDGWEKLFRIAGLDLGQAQDPSALSIIEQSSYGADFIGPREKKQWKVKLLHEWPIGTNYGQVIGDMLNFGSLDVLVIDATGAKPFIDWFRESASKANWRNTRVRPINITGGQSHAKQGENGYVNVPKRELVSSLLMMQHKDTLRVPNTPDIRRWWNQLLQEIKDFQLKLTKAANQQFGAKQGSHDDLLMSLGYCCWWALRAGFREPAMVM